MRDGLGRMQRVVVIGGSSAIAVATAQSPSLGVSAFAGVGDAPKAQDT